MSEEKTEVLADLWKKLQAPFPRDQIELKPQVNCNSCTKVTNDARKSGQWLKAADKHCNRHVVRECQECHAYITSGHIHLDTVGHARTTNRLNEVDPTWTWEPMSKDPRGLPAYDEDGNLWIYLTILGSTKPGVGDGDSLKEKIGDAIRNAAMRFGVALDLWARGELPHRETDDVPPPAQPEAPPPDVDRTTGEVRMIDRGQLIELKTLESKLGKGGKDETDEQREQRMTFYTWATGRDLISSARELTQSEAEMVIGELRKRVPPETDWTPETTQD